jgi:ABC-2 type transport system permease protein
MKPIRLIAADELLYWLRSHLALGGVLIFMLLIIATSILNAVRINNEAHIRTHQQTESEETFLAQPDRHPHRMVHYGHYLFRTPTPLSIVDPGLDAVTGQSIFLEGHRQNTAMFAESAASADLGGLAWLNPAMVYQLFAPLIIIILGYGSVVREREASTLSSMLAIGVTGRQLLAGKALALIICTMFLLLPLALGGMLALSKGESIAAVFALLGIYFLYLVVWTLLTLLVSTLFKKRSTVMAAIIGVWLILCLVLPSIAVNFATGSEPLAGKIETDLKMLSDLRKLGDGHNANDPAFQKLRADLLKKHKVDRIEDLPINYRGIVAVEAEQKLTEVLNEYADSRMAIEAKQEDIISTYGALTPALAIVFASRSIAATDLAHYHRFQREAESVRFDFVQGLNRAHVEELSYQDDINRNKDEASWLRARVDASNWQVLDQFSFQAASVSQRIENALSSIGMLLAWLVISLVLLLWRAGKIKL